MTTKKAPKKPSKPVAKAGAKPAPRKPSSKSTTPTAPTVQAAPAKPVTTVLVVTSPNGHSNSVTVTNDNALEDLKQATADCMSGGSDYLIVNNPAIRRCIIFSSGMIKQSVVTIGELEDEENK